MRGGLLLVARPHPAEFGQPNASAATAAAICGRDFAEPHRSEQNESVQVGIRSSCATAW